MSDTQYEFYYEMMSADERKIYRAMYAGLKNRRYSFTVTYCKGIKLYEIYEKVICDHPEIFFVESIKIYIRGMWKRCQIMPLYKFDRDEMEYMNNEIEKNIFSIVQNCSKKTDIQAEIMIHDYVVSKVIYKDAWKSYSHDVIGVFLYGIGVCEGNAKAFKFLCDRVGIKAGVVVGNVKKDNVAHAWNLVCIDDCWYNVDVTYDANFTKYSGDIRYDYFNLSDSEILDRKALYSIKPCNRNYGYYKRNYKYASCQSELEKIIKYRTSDLITIQLPKINCSEEKMQEIISDAAFNYTDDTENEIVLYPNYDIGVYTIKYQASI